MSCVASPIASPKFLGDALEMTAEEWLQANQVHLRERWRNLHDSCALLGFDGPDESEYLQFSLDHYESQCGLEIYCREAP